MSQTLRGLLALLALTSSSSLLANSGGIFTVAGERATSSCRNCHGSNAPTPDVVVEGLPAAGLVASPGEALLLTITARKARDSVGVAAGFAAATSSAGTFALVPEDSGVRLSSRPGLDNEAAHNAPREYIDGATSWQVALQDLVEGRHTIFVAVNDVNDDRGESGDRVATVRLPLLVCDPDVDSDDDGIPDGCDNCPELDNVEQDDSDEDGVGDGCDNCRQQANANQADLDGDDIGDVCDAVTDECALEVDTCDDLATCTDTAGLGFVCACPAGYIGTTICIDVDECADGLDDCDDLAVCENAVGGFSCTCPAGYEGDGTACADIDECADGTDDCDDLAACDNTNGGFTCACDDGYVDDGTGVCVDIDECADNTDDCGEHSTCVNSPGAWTCPCDPGFTDGNARCVDVDECATGADDCSDTEVCENDEGAFSCVCADGFEANGDGCVARGELCAVDDSCDEPIDSCGSCAAGGGAPVALALLALLRRRRRA